MVRLFHKLALEGLCNFYYLTAKTFLLPQKARWGTGLVVMLGCGESSLTPLSLHSKGSDLGWPDGYAYLFDE